MIIVRTLLLLAFLIASAASASGALPTNGDTGRRIKVLFVHPQSNADAWWQNLTDVMHAAAEDLDMEVESIISHSWPAEYISKVQNRLEGPDRPDFLLITIHKGTSTRMLEVAEAARVPVFVINSGLLDADRTRVGGPRDTFKFWIGQMLPDDYKAGYDLATTLVEAALNRKMKDDRGHLHLVGLGGVNQDYASVERIRGLQSAVAKYPEVKLQQVVHANWSHQEGKSKTSYLLRRYTDTTVIWSANDPMALGAIDALKAAGKTPGKDILVGSIDWEPDALEAVQKGELLVTIDGHFMEAAWAMVLLHDYFRGLDFAEERLSWKTSLFPMNKDLRDQYFRHFQDRNWRKIDFTKFSRIRNQHLESYPFSWNTIFQQLAATPRH